MTRTAAKETAPKAKKRTKKTRKRAAPNTPKALWGPPIQLGTIDGRAVTICEPLNDAAIQELTTEESLLLVMSDTIRKLEAAVGQLQVAVGQLQRETDLSRRLAQVEALTAGRQPAAPTEP